MSQFEDFPLSDREFERLRGLVRRHTAIEIGETKRHLAYTRFSRRLRALGLDSFDAYCDLIDGGNVDEINEFASAITTNFTRFFREAHHFEFLVRLLAEKEPDRRLRIWSAGCATGEEPYSIAITLLEALDDIDSWDIRILATDIDAKALDIANAGIFPGDRLEDIDPVICRRWFRRGRGRFENRIRVADAARRLIRFRELNLIGPWPMRNPFDLIFCRNVVIYFSEESRKSLFARFADMQRPGDHLLVGHSENLAHICSRYEPVGNTVYRRR